MIEKLGEYHRLPPESRSGIKAVIRASHRTMYFESKEAALKFLEDTKSWKVEEWTMEDEEQLRK